MIDGVRARRLAKPPTTGLTLPALGEREWLLANDRPPARGRSRQTDGTLTSPHADGG
jgi:hypothetical protein